MKVCLECVRELEHLTLWLVIGCQCRFEQWFLRSFGNHFRLNSCKWRNESETFSTPTHCPNTVESRFWHCGRGCVRLAPPDVLHRELSGTWQSKLQKISRHHLNFCLIKNVSVYFLFSLPFPYVRFFHETHRGFFLLDDPCSLLSKTCWNGLTQDACR